MWLVKILDLIVKLIVVITVWLHSVEIVHVCVCLCAWVCAALASRCLQLVVHFLPIVRQHFEERLHGKQTNMLKHFEHVLKVSECKSHASKGSH